MKANEIVQNRRRARHLVLVHHLSLRETARKVGCSKSFVERALKMHPNKPNEQNNLARERSNDSWAWRSRDLETCNADHLKALRASGARF